MITFDRVSKRFPDGTVAVDELTLEAPTGQVTVLLGPSGSGKTTSLRMINRLVEPTSGTVALDGRDVRAMPVHELRRGIGYVIQAGGLFPHRTVAQNIATVPELLGWDAAHRQSRALELLDLVGLDRGVADRYPGALSGGQQQRVGVARALAADPPVLIMDEPFGAVDPLRRADLQRQFRRVQQELGTTVVFVTHDVDEAVVLADHIAVLRPGGQLAQQGPTAEVLAEPVDSFVAGFLGASRGQQLLRLRPAAELPVQPLPAGGVAGWTLQVGPDGVPVGWRTGQPDGRDRAVAVQVVGPAGSLRDLLDSALSSPARTAVRVTAAGTVAGIVPWSLLQTHLGSSAGTPHPADSAEMRPTETSAVATAGAR